MINSEFQIKLFINEKSYGKRFLRIRKGESLDHVILKLTGFIIFSQYEPEIERSIGWRYKPDLVAFNNAGEILLWIECSDVAPKKIRKILHKFSKARVVVLKITEREAQTFSGLFKKEKSEGKEIEITGFDEGFIDIFCKQIYDGVTVSSRIKNDCLEISFNSMKIKSKIYRF